MSALFDSPVTRLPGHEYGEVSECDVLLSFAERWIEDGLHVIRSVEFDGYAEHEDAKQVVSVFIDNVYELWDLLYDLVQREEATENEQETFELLTPRLIRAGEARRERARNLRKRDVLRQLRERGKHSSNWQQRATPRKGSSLPSPV